MSEENTTMKNQLIATAAIASTDATKCADINEWQRAVIKRALSIQKLGFYREDGRLLSTLGAVRIVAKVISVEYEESSTRYVITFLADNSTNGEPETIRTSRTDRKDFPSVANDIEHLKAIAGTDSKVVIYKSNEEITEEQRERAKENGTRLPTQGYRVASWFEFL